MIRADIIGYYLLEYIIPGAISYYIVWRLKMMYKEIKGEYYIGEFF
jgi:hypothetical protein